MTCVFFGHRDTPEAIQIPLETLLIHLIENCRVDRFYVGNQGSFDAMVRHALKKIKRRYPHIGYAVVLAYLPGDRSANRIADENETIYPEGLENVLPRYAICYRNRWMIEQADIVVVYVKTAFGGAAQCKQLAEKKGKRVISL